MIEGGQQISFWAFLAASEFAVDVAENWQSEYLQFFLFIVATVWLVQRGRRSPNRRTRSVGGPMRNSR
nr:DUF6766 family protein [Actinophytocola xanthii]